MRLIDADALREQIAEKEELARQRVLDTPSRMPNGNFNPSAMRYATQLDERTQMKFMIVDAPTVDAVPVRHGKFIGTEYDGYADGYPVYYEWKCSECGCIFEDNEPTYKFCPNCGARMDEE